MLLESQKLQQSQQNKKLKVPFGTALTEYVRRKKLVIIYGIDKKWIQELYASDPTRRTLWLQLQWFSEPQQIETEFTALVKSSSSNLYTNQFYAVDSIVNYEGLGGYLDLLDSIASTIEDEGCTVKKVFLEYDTFTFPRDIGFDPYYAKPMTVESFRSLDKNSFVTFDTNDFSLLALPYKEP